MFMRCRKNGITINRDKLVVGVPSVTFCGYILSRKGSGADPNKDIAIRVFPTPTNLTDLRSFMGILNQLAEFTPDITATVQALCLFMSQKRAFIWNVDHDEAFHRVKTALVSSPILTS